MRFLKFIKSKKDKKIEQETDIIIALESKKEQLFRKIKFKESDKFLSLDELDKIIEQQIFEIKKMISQVLENKNELVKKYTNLTNINEYIQILELQKNMTREMITNVNNKKEYIKKYEELSNLILAEQKYKNPKQLEKIGKTTVLKKLRGKLKSSLFSLLIFLACSPAIKMQNNEINYSNQNMEKIEILNNNSSNDSTENKMIAFIDSIRTADSINTHNQNTYQISTKHIRKITCRFFVDEAHLRPVMDTSNKTFDDYFRIHKGIDYVTNDDSAYSHTNGIITNEYFEGTSKTIEITDNLNNKWTYRHLSHTIVNKGDTIKVNQRIGDILETDAKSTAPHIHLEYEEYSKSTKEWTLKDPLKILPTENITVYSAPPTKGEIINNPEHFKKIYKTKYYHGVFDNLDENSNA